MSVAVTTLNLRVNTDKIEEAGTLGNANRALQC